MCDNPFSTEVVLVSKLGKNEVVIAKPDGYGLKSTVNKVLSLRDISPQARHCYKLFTFHA
jgi:hypothetical protein